MGFINEIWDAPKDLVKGATDVVTSVLDSPFKEARNFLDDVVGIDDDGGIIGSTSEVLADINDGVNEVLQDDTFVMVATVALAATGGSAYIPILTGATTGARGGDMNDILGSMAKSYVASELGGYAGELASEAAIAQGAGSTVANVIGSGATGAAVATVYGDDPVEAFLMGGATAGVGAAIDAMFTNVGGALGDIAKGATDTDKVIREVLVANSTAYLTGEDANVATVRALANSLPIVSDFISSAATKHNLNEAEVRTLTNVIQSSLVGAFTDKPASEELMGRLQTEGNKAFNEAVGTGVRETIDRVSGNYQKVAGIVSELEAKNAELSLIKQENYEGLSDAESALKDLSQVLTSEGYPEAKTRIAMDYSFARDDLQNLLDQRASGEINDYSLIYIRLTPEEVRGLEDKLGVEPEKSEYPKIGNTDGVDFRKPKNHYYSVEDALKIKRDRVQTLIDDYNNYKDLIERYNNDSRVRDLISEINDLSVEYKDAHELLVQDTDKLDDELIFVADKVKEGAVKAINPDFDEAFYRENVMSESDELGKSAFEHYLETGQYQGAPTNQKALDLTEDALGTAVTSVAHDYAQSIGLDSFLDLNQETLSEIARQVDYEYGMNRDALSRANFLDLDLSGLPEDQTTNPMRKSYEFAGLTDAEQTALFTGGKKVNVDKDGLVGLSDASSSSEDEYYSTIYGTDVVRKVTTEEVERNDGRDYVTKTIITDKNTGAVLSTDEQIDQSFAMDDLFDSVPELAVKAIRDFGQQASDMSGNYLIKALKAELEESGDSRVLEVVARGGGQALKAFGYTYALLAGAEDDPSRVNLYALADAIEMAGNAATPEDVKAIEEKMSKAIGDAEGLGKVKAFFGNFVDHPTEALIKYVGVEAAGELLPLMVGGAASLTAKLGGKVLTKTMAKDLAKEQINRVAGNAGYSAAIASDMLESFGANAEDTYNEAYKAAIKSGMSEEQAKETAYEKSLSVGVMAAVTTGALSKFGGGALEKEIFSPKSGINGKELFSAFSNKVKKGVKVTGKETGAEALDEGVINAYKEMELYDLDPSRDITGNIALAATMGAVVGGTISGSVYTGMQTGDIATDILIAGNDKVKKALRNVKPDGTNAGVVVEILQQYGINDPNIVGRALSTQMNNPDQVRQTLGNFYEPDGEPRTVPFNERFVRGDYNIQRSLDSYSKFNRILRFRPQFQPQADGALQQFMEYSGIDDPAVARTIANAHRERRPYDVNALNSAVLPEPVEMSTYVAESELPDPVIEDPVSEIIPDDEEIFVPTEDVEPTEEIVVPTEDVEPTEEIVVPTEDAEVDPDLDIPMTPDEETGLDEILDSDEEILIPDQEEVVVPDEEIVVPTEDVEPTEEVVVPTEDVEVDPDLEVPIPPPEDLVTDNEIIPVDDAVEPEEEIVVPTEDVEPEEEIVVPDQEEVIIPDEDIFIPEEPVIDDVTDEEIQDIINEVLDPVAEEDQEDEITVPVDEEVDLPEEEITVPTDEVIPDEEIVVPVEDDLSTDELIDDIGKALEGTIKDAISVSETATGDLISALEKSVSADIKSITDTIDGLTKSGSSRDDAIATVAKNLGTTEEALKKAISESEKATSKVISDLEGAIDKNIEGIEGQIESLEKAGASRDDAIKAVADSIISEETLQDLIAETVTDLELTSSIEEEIDALSEAIAELQQEFEMPEGSLDVEQGAPGEFYFGAVESLEPIINTQTGEPTGDQMVTVRVGDELLDPVPVSSLADSNLKILGNEVVRADYRPVALSTSQRDIGPVITDSIYDYSDLPGFENVPTDLPDLTPEQDTELNRIVARSATDSLLKAQDVEEARRAGIDPNTLRTAFSNYRIGAFTEEPEGPEGPDDLGDIMLGIPDYDMDPFGIEFGDIDFSIPERQRPRFYSPPVMPRRAPPRRTPTPFDFGDRGVFNFPGAPDYGAAPTGSSDFYRDFGQFISSEGLARELQRPLIDPRTGALIPSQYAPAYMGPRSLIEETGEGMYIDPVLAGLEPE